MIRNHGDRMRRQVLIGHSVIHFVLPYRNLLINLFGRHAKRDAAQVERLDRWLKSLGFHYLELTNMEVVNSPHEVIEAIESFAECAQAYQNYRSAKRVARQHELVEL